MVTPPFTFGLSAFENPTATALDQLPRLQTRRVPYDLGYVFPAGEAMRWGAFDARLAEAERRGVQLEPVISGVPRADRKFPATQTDLYSVLYAVAGAVLRYQGRVKHWQVFNEPNASGAISPTFYAKVLADVTDTIHQADRDALAVSAGMTWLPSSSATGGMRGPDYIRAMLASPWGIAADVLAAHGYAQYPYDVRDHCFKFRAAFDSDPKQAGKRLWVTELGWMTGGSPTRSVVTEAQQADYLARTRIHLLLHQDELRLERANWFGWQDHSAWSPPTFRGLLREDGSHKPAFATFAGML